MKISLFIITLAVLPGFVFIAGSQAELYQYKDKSGVVIITDKKPEKAGKVTTFKTPETKPDTKHETKTEEAGGQEAAKPEKDAKPEQISPEAAAAEAENKAAAEAQKNRNEEADRLEAEARQPVQFSKEQQIEQLEKLERAKQLRKGIDAPAKSDSR